MHAYRILLARVVGMALAVSVALSAAVGAGVNTWTGGGPAGDSDANAELIATDPRDPYVVYAVFQPSLYKSVDGGNSWVRIATYSRIHSLLVHPVAPDTVYLGVADNPSGFVVSVQKSSDGGATWARKQVPTAPRPDYGPIVLTLAGSPADASTIFVGAYAKVFKSTDGGETWGEPGSTASVIASLVVSPRDPEIVYAGTEAGYYFSLFFNWGSFTRSTNGGSSWSATPVGLPERVGAIAVDPEADATLYLGLSSFDEFFADGGILRSEDGGATFSRADSGLPTDSDVFSLVVDPLRPSTLYAGTGSGVFRSRDSGASWAAVGQTLAGEAVRSLAISTDGRRIAAGTASGAFHLDLVSGPVDIAAMPGGGARVLRWNSDRLAVQTVDGSNNWTATPFSATSQFWSGVAIASAGDGPSRVLWQNGDGRSALEKLSSDGGSSSTVFDDSDGIPADVAFGGDGGTRLLWTNAAGAMHIRTIAADGSEGSGPVYGPTRGWRAVAVDVDAQGRSWVLWRAADGRAAVSVHVDGTLTTTVKWDATQGWWVEDLGLGADGRARVLARNVSGAMQVWTVGEDGSRSVGATHESPGLVPRRIAGGADGLTRVLWGGDHGEGAVWFLTNSGNHVSVEVPVLP